MAFTEIDEKLLVRAYQAGDERAFDTIVRTQYNALYAHALRRLTQHEAAEDAVQDTMLRAYRALPNLDGDLALRAWLHRILTNVCHDEGNRRRRQQGLVEKVGALPEEVAADPIEEAVLHDTVRIMSEALQDLPDSYREALVLRYVDGLSFREVAEATGVSEENARARVQRGKSALHKIMARLAVMVAFIVPGMRRAHPPAGASTVAADPAAVAPGLSDHSVNLATQLTSHVMTSAPTMSRLAEAATSMSGGKSALAAAAVTAVAAVSVPVAVTAVHDATKTERPPAAVAAPFPHRDGRTVGSASTSDDPKGSSSTPASSSTTSSSSTTLAPSQAHPFDPTLGLAATPTTQLHRSEPSSTTTTVPTTTAPTTSTTTPVNQGPTVEARLGGDSITVSGTAPQWDADGRVSLVASGKATTGTLSGRFYVYDDGTAESDQVAVDLAGKALQLRIRGRVTGSSTTDGVTTYRISGQYVFTGADAFGVAERGNVALVFRVGGGAPASMSFDLVGHTS